MEKFWKIRNNLETGERTLYLNGTIAQESWFDDDITPQLFKDDLNAGTGNITVWLNSPGGDVWAAASIYNMLIDYKGKVTVKIDGLAASAASMIAMAGDSVLMSPVSMLMIHNPATIAMGNTDDMQKAIDMLNEVKESIINAYATKTGLSHNKLSKLMDDETWMDAKKALELGFADALIDRSYKEPEEDEDDDPKKKEDITNSAGFIFSAKPYNRAVLNKVNEEISSHETAGEEARNETAENTIENKGNKDVYEKRLLLLKKLF